MKYYMQIEAFQFTDRSDEAMKSYPDWFHRAIADGRVKPCATGFHIHDKNINEHIYPGEYVVLDTFNEAMPEEQLATMPKDDFELAFKPMGEIQ